jgi:hypothetical protein
MAKSKRNLSKKRKTRRKLKTRKNLKGGGFTYVGPRDKNWVDSSHISDEDIGKDFLKGTRIQISNQPIKFDIDKTTIKYLGKLKEITSNYYFVDNTGKKHYITDHDTTQHYVSYSNGEIEFHDDAEYYDRDDDDEDNEDFYRIQEEVKWILSRDNSDKPITYNPNMYITSRYHHVIKNP